MRTDHLRRIISEEITGVFSFRSWLLRCMPRLLPAGGAGRIRAQIYRILGIAVGRGTLIFGPLILGPQSSPRSLRIGARCFINSLVYIDAAGPVTIGDGVSIGHHVVIITSDHAIGPSAFRAGELCLRPVTIGNGSWIAAGAMILPGVTIGAGAIVAAGAVVTRDVAPDTLVGGVPARAIRDLETVEPGRSRSDGDITPPGAWSASLPALPGETIPDRP
ncbi:MAG: acyltransferase [Cytophagales bacterium]|nr:acyltransferase [Armatimonadota bacterium]